MQDLMLIYTNESEFAKTSEQDKAALYQEFVVRAQAAQR